MCSSLNTCSFLLIVHWPAKHLCPNVFMNVYRLLSMTSRFQCTLRAALSMMVYAPSSDLGISSIPHSQKRALIPQSQWISAAWRPLGGMISPIFFNPHAADFLIMISFSVPPIQDPRYFKSSTRLSNVPTGLYITTLSLLKDMNCLAGIWMPLFRLTT